jgi:hypothetical protein
MRKVFAIASFVICLAAGGAVRAERDAGPEPDAGLTTLEYSALILSQEFPDAGADDGAPQQPAEPLPSLEESSQALVDATKTGSLIAVVGALITMLVSLLRSPRTGALVQLIPARWRVLVPVGLAILAGLLGYLGTDMSLAEVLMVAFFAGPAAVFGHETVNEAIRGQRFSRAATVKEEML